MKAAHCHGSDRQLQYWLVVVLLLLGGQVRAESIGSSDLSVEYAPGTGAKISVRGVPVIRGTSLQLHSPDWSKGYYSTMGSPPTVEAGEKQIVIQHRAGRGTEFVATETIRLVEPHRLELTLEGALTNDVVAKMEWTLGYINAFALYGGGYAAGEDVKITPIVPMAPRDTGNCAVVRDSRAITLTSPVGALLFQMQQGGGKTSLLDGRLDLGRWWSRETPSFWIGCLSEDVPVRKPFKYVVTIEYRPAAAAEIVAPVSARAKTRSVPDAFIPQPRPIQIIPQPKKLVWNEGKYRLKDSQIPAQFQKADWPDPERHKIHCDANGIQISTASEQGQFYARKTLEQMIQSDADGMFIPACDIDDWPTMKFRGVHLFPGKDALDFHRKLIERIFARYKLNHVVLECEFAQWDANPKLWTDISVPKDQLREYVKTARENHIEPIPLVQSLGHAEWMFKNGQNRDLAEDPRVGWAYDATNPASYEFIGKVYDEAIELFHPKFFHIGHDEVTMRGEFPYRQESKKHSVAELFAMDVKKLDAYFRPKNIRMMLWGDMMLSKGESNDGAANAPSAADAKLMRAAIPKDAVVCDWHYSPAKPDAYKSLKAFKDDGLQTVASTWYNPLNIESFAEGARKYDALGLLQTTWAGFNLDERAMQKDFQQFTAYILAAEYAWSGQTTPPDELPYRADEVFTRAFNPAREVRAEVKRAGTIVDLAEIANLKLEEDPIALSALPRDERFDGVQFDQDDRAVVLAGALIRQSLPKTTSIQIDASADTVAFVHATGFPANVGDEVGAYEVAFADGTTERVALIYGVNIRGIEDRSSATDATFAWTGKSSRGVAAGLRLFLWTNPHPEKRIKTITFSTNHPYASPILLGLTCLSDTEPK